MVSSWTRYVPACSYVPEACARRIDAKLVELAEDACASAANPADAGREYDRLVAGLVAQHAVVIDDD